MKLENQSFNKSSFKSSKEIILNDKKIYYDVISEDNIISDDYGKPLGSIFSYTYIRTDIENKEDRPVIFVYNGGPGSSCMWLHLGFFGPRRVKLEDPINPPTVPPFELEDNPYTLLDICDIVMIDPVECGYGRLIDKDASGEFFTLEKDALSIAIFIENWINKYNRWNSPKYLAGESYGTVRSAVLVNTLMGGPTTGTMKSVGIPINGIIMLGSCIPVDSSKSNHYYYETSIEDSVLGLPSMAATNWYHNDIKDKALEEFVEEAYDFCADEYLKNLYLGNRMTEDEKNGFIEKLVYYTGLSKEYLLKNNCRIKLNEFAGELLRAKGQKVGEYDSRYVLKSSNNIGTPDPVADDGAMGTYTPAFMGAMAKYAKEELEIDFNRSYNIINFMVNGLWQEDQFKSPIEYLRAALRRNKSLKVFIANGYYDLVTTIGAARYSAANLPKEQVILKEYESGHMSYLGEESVKKLHMDLEEFIISKM